MRSPRTPSTPGTLKLHSTSKLAFPFGAIGFWSATNAMLRSRLNAVGPLASELPLDADRADASVTGCWFTVIRVTCIPGVLSIADGIGESGAALAAD